MAERKFLVAAAEAAGAREVPVDLAPVVSIMLPAADAITNLPIVGKDSSDLVREESSRNDLAIGEASFDDC